MNSSLKETEEWDWDANIEMPDHVFYFIIGTSILPVILFFSLWSWLGWKLFVNN